MNEVPLFSSVPTQDYLSLFQAGEPDYAKVVQFLGFKKTDVARASNVSVHSVRYDHKIPKELEDRVREWAIALNLVAEYFKDQDKTVLWFKAPNPLLGNMPPRDMIRLGRFRKLHRFILNALSENQRDAA